MIKRAAICCIIFLISCFNTACDNHYVKVTDVKGDAVSAANVYINWPSQREVPEFKTDSSGIAYIKMKNYSKIVSIQARSGKLVGECSAPKKWPASITVK